MKARIPGLRRPLLPLLFAALCFAAAYLLASPAAKADTRTAPPSSACPELASR